MLYEKPALSFEQQAELLLARGLRADKTDLVERLKRVNYYRITGYLYPFRRGLSRRMTSALFPDADPEHFVPGTTLEHFWQRYTFDRALRHVVFQAIERIENAVKAQMAEIYSNEYGAFGLEDAGNFPGFGSPQEHADFIAGVEKDFSRSREDFVEHFRAAYGDSHRLPPLWATVEVMSFGSIVTLYRNSDEDIQQRVADYFGLKRYILASWLLNLNTTRNLCAHHARLYNRSLGLHLKIWKQWDRAGIPRNRVFGLMCAISVMLQHVSDDRDWAREAARLMKAHPDLAQRMGAPHSWETLSMWADVC